MAKSFDGLHARHLAPGIGNESEDCGGSEANGQLIHLMDGRFMIRGSNRGRKNRISPFTALVKRWSISLFALGIGAIHFCGFFLSPASEAAREKPKAAAPAVPVLAVAAKTGDVPVYLSAIGTVTPTYTVTVRTRVDGELLKVHYREGQIVKAGDLLVQIDPRPFQVQLIQAEGQMARDVALLKNGRLDLERYRVLWEQDSIPRQQLDTQESLVRQYEAVVKSDQGPIESAKLQLLYCNIRAPIGGRIGLRLVDPGNIVHASDAGGLLVITELRPITVIFPIPEDGLTQVLSAIKRGESLPVEAYDRDLKEKLAAGSLLTIDNQIDPSTGTVRLKAVFPNEEDELFPNQFVNVRMAVKVRKGVIVIPASAVQRSAAGPFVYVVKEDRTAAVRQVGVGEIQSGTATILSGLSPGEMVVIEGAGRLREGAQVELKSSGPRGAE